MALRKPSLESARCSAGELTLGELGSDVCDSEDRPLVNMLKLGRAAMIAGGRQTKRLRREVREGKLRRQFRVRSSCGMRSSCSSTVRLQHCLPLGCMTRYVVGGSIRSL